MDSLWPVRVSNLFAPVQTLGLVTDGLPIAVYRSGTEHFIASSVGNSFHLMDVKKLQIVLRSPIFPHTITALAASNSGKGTIFVAVRNTNEILIFERLKEKARLPGHRHHVIGMFALGSVLVSWSHWEVMIWNLDTLELSGKLPTPQNDETGEIGYVIHPETYLNKILVGYRYGGELQLWNIRSLKKIHSFRSVQPKSLGVEGRNNGTKLCEVSDGLSVGITAMSLSIHPHIVALGYSNGVLRLLDINKDEVICELYHSSEQGAIRSISYRSDSTCSTPGTLITGCDNGDIVVWNTVKSIVSHVVESAHQEDCGVSIVQCISGEPLMVSSGGDNSIHLWIFDGVEEQPRILRQRQGLPAAIEQLEIYDDQGRDLLTIGTFRNRCFFGKTSAIQQRQNCQFSQKKALKVVSQKWRAPISQLPPCIDIAHSFCRHYDWPNIATCHEGMTKVFLWSGHDKALIPRTIDLPYISPSVTQCKGISPVSEAAYPTALAISACGNFLVVGYSTGAMHRFNLQSGRHRGPYCRSAKSDAHEGPVTRIEIKGSAEVFSASYQKNNCLIRKWDLDSQRFVSEMRLDTSTGFNSIQTFKSIGVLIAVVLSTLEPPSKRVSEFLELKENNDNNTQIATGKAEEKVGCSKVVIIDFQNKGVVREFPPISSDRIASLAFSRDSRWLSYSTLYHPYMYVYDILSTSLIDWIELPSAALSIEYDFSNAFVYLGLQHLKGGVLVIANKHIFDPTVSAPLLAATPTKPIRIGDPLPEDSNDTSSRESKIGEARAVLQGIRDTFVEDQLEPGKLTLSGQSEGRLQAILYLEKIKERNAPQTKPETASDAPFFLPTVYQGKELKFALPSTKIDKFPENAPDNIARKKQLTATDTLEVLQPDTLSFQSILQQHLAEFKEVIFGSSKKTEQTIEKRKCIMNKILEYLRELSPSAIHLTLTDLGPLSGGTTEELELVVEFFCDCVKSRKDADFVQALLHVFLEAHSELLVEMARKGLDDTSDNVVHGEHDVELTDREQNKKKSRSEAGVMERLDGEVDELVQTKSHTETFRGKLMTLRQYLREDWTPIDLQCHQLSCFIKFLVHVQIE